MSLPIPIPTLPPILSPPANPPTSPIPETTPPPPPTTPSTTTNPPTTPTPTPTPPTSLPPTSTPPTSTPGTTSPPTTSPETTPPTQPPTTSPTISEPTDTFSSSSSSTTDQPTNSDSPAVTTNSETSPTFAPTQPPPSITQQTQAFTTVRTSTQSNGSVVYLTSINTVTRTGSAGASASSTAAGEPTSFFDNKAAVAGTFSAVGVVALVIIGFLITAGIRRRRARKFDDEVEEAAAEAAKATDRAYMDDDDYSPGGGANSQHTGYSDVTHGTFAQQPMSVESYGMREINPGGYVNYHDIQPAGQAQADYNPYGAAGVGAVGRSKSMRDPNGSTPYNAFAQPHYTADTNPYAVHTQHTDYPSGSDPYDTSASQNRQADLLDAAGLSTGAAAGASMASNPSRRSAAAAAQERGVALGRSPSQVPTLHNGADLQRNKSISLEPGFFDPGAPPLPTGPSAHGGLVSGKSGMTGYNPPAQESYADRYAPEGLVLARKKSTASRSPTTPSRPSSMLDPYPTAPPAPAPTLSQSSHGADLIGGQRSSRVMSYGSDSDDDELPPMRPHLATHDSRASFQDAQDYGYNGGARVLRVANE